MDQNNSQQRSQSNSAPTRSEEKISSQQMLTNVTWAIGSVVGFVGTIQLIGWLMGAL